ncbi:hypothetical protein CBF90_02125 [Microbacterium sp. AISO3]|uniref:Abi family protein n=1 Tax=Microbacterium sp. AISO3 TaxID=2002831 RepID=UPI000B70A9FD|nr:Abi family protein [Microbacterium sp. AISO3]OWP20301.1 hypothetical protein CBF90_17120 [Microbacterium sp. AISO3]OWP23546.1 hypothetical protein CBF90_02125 [Microbacterium sp. AISO3]
MSPSVKQYLTIDQQIELLRSRGMEIDGDPARWLRAVNYYRLSGYWYIYRALGNDGQGNLLRTDEFLPGTTFSTIADLYEFDRKLRTLVHDGLERVEVALRSHVSYVLGARDPLAHENPAVFRESFDHAAWLADARSRVNRAAKRSAFIRHHAEQYGGVIPIWVLVDVLDFSDVSILLDGMSAADQYAVAEGLGIRINLEALKPLQRRKALKNHPRARWLEQLTVVRNIAAGFDAIELHGAHGYLLHEFLSPVTNRRDDRWGADRAALLLATVAAVRAEMPEGMPLIVRLSVDDVAPGGSQAADSAELARRLHTAGVDLVDCSSGGLVAGAEYSPSPGYQVPGSAVVRAAGVPTAAVGVITDPRHADRIVADGDADLVLLGREMLRDPHWARRAELALTGAASLEPRYHRAYL